MTAPALEIKGLDVAFPGLERTIHAVRGVDLVVGRGEVVGLVGESGSGKSVTALACLGLLPGGARVRGSIRTAGHQVVGAGGRALARVRGARAAMIFQNPATALNPFFTVGRQVIDVARRHKGLTRIEARARAVEAFGAVRLPDPVPALEKYPHQLSGGQVQRIMIAMALVCEPELLVADEPTTALDVTVQAQIITLVRDIVASRGLSVLFITHDLAVVAALCDRVTVMYAGRIVEQGPVGPVLARPAHPYTAKLVATVPTLGHGRAELSQIPGQVPDMSRPPGSCAFHPRCDRASARCRTEAPPPRASGDGRRVACHHPLTAAVEPALRRAGAEP